MQENRQDGSPATGVTIASAEILMQAAPMTFVPPASDYDYDLDSDSGFDKDCAFD